MNNPIMKIWTVVCLASAAIGYAQSNTVCTIAVGPNQSICAPNCATLTGTFVPTFQTSTYNSSAIPYAPDPFNAGTTVALGDDDWSGLINIPFTFCFYGASYTQCVIGSNGMVTFDLANANGYCPWPIAAAVPSVLDPTNTIMGPWQDLNPNIGGTVRYAVYGTAPCRRFVISWDAVPMYSCTGLKCTQQIALYETTNIVENFVKDKFTCNTWNGGYAIQALHNANGTLATVIPGNNYPTVWSATSTGWRYTPSGPVSSAVSWFQGTTPIATTVNTVTGTATAVVCPTSNTTYTLQQTITNCAGANTVMSGSMTVNASALATTLTQTNPPCAGSCNSLVIVNASGGVAPYSYLWTPGGYTTQTVVGLCAGTYSCTVTDANGCQGVQVVTIANPLPITLQTIVASPSCGHACDGVATVVPSGGTAPYTYLWLFGGQTTQSIVDCPGTYTCIVTDANGCTASTPVTIPPPVPLAVQTFSSSPLCAHACNGVISLVTSGGTAPYTYLWSNGQTSSSIVVCAGTFSCTVTDANGCQTTVTVTLTDPPQLTATTTQYNPCFHQCNGFASVIAAGGTTPYTYLWSNGQTNLTATGLCAGTYSVIVTDANGCTVTQTVTLIQQPPVPSTILSSAPGPFCTTDPPFFIAGLPIFDNAAFTGTFSSPTGSQVSNVGFINAYQFNPAAATPGLQTINFTVINNSNGCSSTSSLSFQVNAPPQIFFSSFADICINSGGNLTLNNYVFPLGGSFSGAGVTGPPGNQMFNPQIAGLGTHTITYTLSQGACTSTATATITVIQDNWQQTSSATTGADIGRDITTDANGNVYVTGDISSTTTFGSGVNTITVPGSGMFVAKYDDCGILHWVAYTTGGSANGRGITFDPVSNTVYVTGSLLNSSVAETFVSALVNPNILVPCANPPIIFPMTSSSYIARFDATDGCLINAVGYGNLSSAKLDANSIDEEGGNVFVTGSVTNVPSGIAQAFVSKVDGTTLIPTWTALSTGSLGQNVGRDVVVQGSNVYVIGSFQGKIDFGGILLTTVSNQDAFIYRLNDAGTAWTPTWGQKGGATSGQKATGESVAINNAGFPFITGSYTGSLTPCFGNVTLAGAPAIGSAFVCRLNPNTGVPMWQRSIRSGSVEGTGITVDQSGLFATGSYKSTATIFFTSGPAVVAPTGPWEKIYVTRINPGNGNMVWNNRSTNVTSTAIDLHRSEGISVNNSGFVYTTGHYQGVMDLPPFLPAPQGQLTATGTPGAPNVFVVREQVTGAGNFMRLMEDDSATIGYSSGFAVSPNPNNGHFMLTLTDNSYDGNFNVEIFDVTGNMVYNRVATGTTQDINAEFLSNGMYLIRVTQGEQVYQDRIIIDK